MIRTFVYRGQSVVIDDSLSLPAEFRPQQQQPQQPGGDTGHGHHEPSTKQTPPPHDHSGHEHSGHDHDGHHPPSGGGITPGPAPAPVPPKHDDHTAHGDIRIQIGHRTVMAYRVPSGYYFHTHALPFVQFTNIDDLAKAVVDQMQLGEHHGSAKESK